MLEARLAEPAQLIVESRRLVGGLLVLGVARRHGNGGTATGIDTVDGTAAERECIGTAAGAGITDGSERRSQK